MKKDRQESLHKDPVCGMLLSPKTAAETARYKDKTYYFCAELCRKQFEADPVKYLRNRGRL